MNGKYKLKPIDIAIIGMAVAIIEACKVSMQALPNIELTSFWIIMFTLVLGWKVVFVVPIFTIIEGSIYGFGLWWVMYLYAWPVLAVIVWIFREKDSAILYSIISGLFGLFFGALCSIPYLFIGGPSMMFSWWIAGIPFDIIHCISNFILMIILYKPVRKIMISMLNK